MDIKLAQELTSVDQDPIFLVFLDLQKAYGTLDRGSILKTLEGYGAGLHICKLLAVFWDQQEVVTRQNRYHGPHFKSTRGAAQLGSYRAASST